MNVRSDGRALGQVLVGVRVLELEADDEQADADREALGGAVGGSGVDAEKRGDVGGRRATGCRAGRRAEQERTRSSGCGVSIPQA